MGFLPAKAKARGDALAEVAGLRATLVFYARAGRIVCLPVRHGAGAGDREACVARELTKL